MNSGISPYRLPKNQCAFSVNCTFRGDYVKNRPPYRLKTLTFSNEAVRQAFVYGYWQGGEWYQPDVGNFEIICSISGRIFRVVPSTGQTAYVDEITISGDPNSASQPQTWMHQAEKWMVITNGLDIPIFYDGISCRRSVPESQQLAIIGAPGFTAPNIGETVSVPVSVSYTGRVGDVVWVDTANPNEKVTYALIGSGGTVFDNKIVLKNVFAPSGASIPANTTLVYQPSNLGQTVSPISTSADTIQIRSALPVYVATGMQVTISDGVNTSVWRITAIASNRLSMSIALVSGTVSNVTPAKGSITLVGYNQPNVTVATVKTAFTSPAVGGTVSVSIKDSFVQPDGMVVFIGGDEWQVVSHTDTVTAPLSVTLQNLSDVPTTAHSAGQLISSLPEIPVSRMGAYGMGRSWSSLTDGISFIGGDIVGGSSGSPIYGGRDAVLKVTENTYLAGGGSFRVPGNGQQITAFKFISVLDASLGTGNLQVFTDKAIYGCNTPADRSTWDSLTDPILVQTLIGAGATGQRAIVGVNGDILFRSPSPNGIRSLLMARLDFNKWGNTPCSSEMEKLLNADNTSGLPFVSAIQFDNRMLMTASPQIGNTGAHFKSLVALNFQPTASLSGKAPSIYDGMWTGLDVFQLVSGSSGGSERAFAFALDSSQEEIALYEFTQTGDNQSLDFGLLPVVWSFESPIVFGPQTLNKEYFEPCKLIDGEFYLSGIPAGGHVRVKVEYRPDFSECWYPWRTVRVCSNADSNVGQYRTRVGLGRPTEGTTSPVNGTPTNIGRWFQLRFTISGACVFQGCKLSAALEPEPEYARVFDEIPPSESQFVNQQVFSSAMCAEGQRLVYSGTPPKWIFVDGNLNKAVGAAGYYTGMTQVEADQVAQANLDSWVTAALALGTLTCETIPSGDCIDWSQLEVCDVNFTNTSVVDSTYTATPAAGVLSATINRLVNYSNGASGTSELQDVGGGSAITYNGASCNCNASVTIDKNVTDGGLSISDFYIAVWDITNSVNLLFETLDTLANGVYSYPFTLPDTGGSPILVKLQIVNALTGSCTSDNQFLGVEVTLEVAP